MAVKAKPIIQSVLVTNAQVTQYIAPTATQTIIDKFTATNTSGSAATLSVNMVPSAGAAATANLVMQAKAIAAGETYTCPELVGHILNTGDFISTIAGTTGVITIRASGREVN